MINGWGAHAGWRSVDPPPFFWLQGLVSCNALLLTVAVLIRQNRMAQAGEHRSHLDLQINLLSEQKVTKILQMVDELQRELTALRGTPGFGGCRDDQARRCPGADACDQTKAGRSLGFQPMRPQAYKSRRVSGSGKLPSGRLPANTW